MTIVNRIKGNNFDSMSKCVLEENAIEIHRWLLLIVAVFASAFSIVSFLLYDIVQALVSILGVIGAFVAHLIHQRGLLYGSKLFNAIQIIVMLATKSWKGAKQIYHYEGEGAL